ncbi:MAG: N-6 DNA methylase [Desulfobacterales bacterium]
MLNIPRKDRLHRGSADTLYNCIIIEFENSLKASLKHAKEQLAGYLLGQFRSGEGYNFTLIASDCITWKVFAPDVSQIDDLENLTEDELRLEEVKSASFELGEDNAEDFYYWIDRFLFREQKQKATLKRMEESFGHQSAVFIESFRLLSAHFKEVKKYGEVQVSLEQWRRFLSIAYGSFDDSEKNFLIHTWLSIFSKMLAHATVSSDEHIDDDSLAGIISGSIFSRHNLQNFVENDFFHWINSERSFRDLKKVFRLVAQEISGYDFSNVDEDILKGVYQELIDLDTRHGLGEYYTPDWLCERIVNEFEFKPDDKILDPACGSGSFLRAVIHRMKENNPGVTAEELSESICGIDIHPLSVQIAKTTVLLALGKGIGEAEKPVHINIILANTLLSPQDVEKLFGGEFSMQIDQNKLRLSTKIFEDVNLFDKAIEICDELADQSMNSKKESVQTFQNSLMRRYKKMNENPKIIDSFYSIYETLKSAKEEGRDSIWKFIVQNLYKPYFLSNKFDYVIGNPPWFTLNSVKNEEYQNTLIALAEQYDIKPIKAANMAQLEIASVFFAHCANYFLKAKGKIIFVIPRSFFSADHHDNTRSGKAKGFKLTQVWDLDKVKPLFRIPSGVLFAEKTVKKPNMSKDWLNGKSFSGNLPAHNCSLKTADKKLTEMNNKWFYNKQGNASALSTKRSKSSNKTNQYKNEFKLGATLFPRNFYFIEINQENVPNYINRIINMKTAGFIKLEAKEPWKKIDFSDKVESNFLFRTALAKSILPFALHKPDLILLPLIIEKDSDNYKTIRLLSPSELRHNGFLYASKWFKNADDIWNKHKTERSKNLTANDRINYQKGITSQDINKKYLVIYNTSGKDANGTVIQRKNLDLEFIVDYKSFVFYTDSFDEANYLAAILNSSIPNERMKDFQSRGLFGARDVCKKILDIYWPKFDRKNKIHLHLAELGRQAHDSVSKFLAENIAPDQKIEGVHLGKLRLEIKAHLHKEMKEIDTLVKRIMETV